MVAGQTLEALSRKTLPTSLRLTSSVDPGEYQNAYLVSLALVLHYLSAAVSVE